MGGIIEMLGYSLYIILLTADATMDCFYMYSLTETNIAPSRKPSQKENSLLTINFQVLC